MPEASRVYLPTDLRVKWWDKSLEEFGRRVGHPSAAQLTELQNTLRRAFEQLENNIQKPQDVALDIVRGAVPQSSAYGASVIQGYKLAKGLR